METFKVEGIILQTTDFGDANRVVTLFTEEFGKLDVNAYGCRRAKSPFSGVMQMFNHISAELSRGSKVDTVRDADIVHFYPAITADLERLAYASLFFEIVNRMTLPKFPEKPVFDLLKRFLPFLNDRNPKIAALMGACQFMQFSGIQLNFDHCVHCNKKIEGDAYISLPDGGAVCQNCVEFSNDATDYPENLRLTFEKMLNFLGREDEKISFKPQQIRAAEDFFLNYIQSELGRELNSAKFIRQLSTSF